MAYVIEISKNKYYYESGDMKILDHYKPTVYHSISDAERAFCTARWAHIVAEEDEPNSQPFTGKIIELADIGE